MECHISPVDGCLSKRHARIELIVESEFAPIGVPAIRAPASGAQVAYSKVKLSGVRPDESFGRRPLDQLNSVPRIY